MMFDALYHVGLGFPIRIFLVVVLHPEGVLTQIQID
jgi:hypothetical protein